MIDENMVERVARALYDDWVREEGDRGEEYCSWDMLPDKDTWRPRARAVFEEMREPTEAMVQAAMRAVELDTLGSPEDDARTTWRAMIDAASGPIPIVDINDIDRAD